MKKALLASLLLLTSGCASQSVGIQHLSDPFIRDYGIDSVCYRGTHDVTGHLSAEGSFCKNIGHLDGYSAIAGVWYTW